MANLSQLLGITAPITIAEGHIKVVFDPATEKVELVVDDEKLGPLTIPPLKAELDVGAVAHIAANGVGSLLGGVFAKKPQPG